MITQCTILASAVLLTFGAEFPTWAGRATVRPSPTILTGARTRQWVARRPILAWAFVFTVESPEILRTVDLALRSAKAGGTLTGVGAGTVAVLAGRLTRRHARFSITRHLIAVAADVFVYCVALLYLQDKMDMVLVSDGAVSQ